MKAGCTAGPVFHFERGLSTGQRNLRFETPAAMVVPPIFSRTELRSKVASRRLVVRAQGDSRDASKPGSTPPSIIKQTVKKEVGLSDGKSTPHGSEVVSDSRHHAEAAGLNVDPNSYEERLLNAPTGAENVSSSTTHWEAATDARMPTSFNTLEKQRTEREAKDQKTMSEAVSGTMSYASVAENLRKEVDKPKPGPIRSEVLERAAPKPTAPKPQPSKSEERPFKEPQQEERLDLKAQSATKGFNFKALLAIVAILAIAFGFAPVWSPIVGKVLTPFFQLVGVAVAVKFFVTDFLRGDKRKELYAKGEKLKEDVTGKDQ